MRIAILGGGFAGLATCWFLLHYSKGGVSIDIYDPVPLGKGVSSISSGMLNPYAGKFARRSWEADRGLKETHRLLTEASRSISRPLILSKGILRPALTVEQIDHFQSITNTFPGVEWWDQKRCQHTIQGLRIPEGGGALFVKDGLTLDVPSYFEGLWQACALLGTQWIQKPITHEKELEPYQRVLIAIGAASKQFLPLKDLPISVVKGQILELAWPDNLPSLPYSLNSEKFVVMNKSGKSCFAGSTYEHDFQSQAPDSERASKDILPNITSYLPALKDALILNCRSGFRAGTPNRLPFVGKVSDKYYFFTGLGSKGLLYHAWVGKRVARAMLTGDVSHFPEKLYFKASTF